MATDLDGMESAERGYRRLSLIFQPPATKKDQRCERCKQIVYQQERIGPVNDVIFHKQCFRCCVCSGALTLKNYWSNQGDATDREVYCQRHAPRIGGSRVDKSAMGIQRALSAQDNFRKASKRMSEIRFQGEQPAFALDHEALNIKAGMAKTSRVHNTDSTEGGFSIDQNALHIRGALDAQLLQRRYQRNHDKHHYPPHVARKREQLFDRQKRLEERLRQEEDEMFKVFHAERKQEDKTIEKEIDVEWEKKLEELTQKFDRDMDKKKKKIKDSDKKLMTIQFENEKKDLANTMRSKKEKKKKTMTLRLRQKEQQQTSDLVKKQSQLMLQMLAKEQEEIKNQIVMELAQRPAPPPSQNGSDSSNVLADQQQMEEVIELLTIPAVVQPPAPTAPTARKEEVLPDESVFESIDEQVIKVAESEQQTFTDLVRQLTENLVSDLEKARAIYRWICVKDLNVMEFADDLDADTPMGLLRGIKFGTETYHVLFMRLCSYAGLHCVEVKGHSKSVGYEPGMKITPDAFQNTWNAVCIDGEWRLVQCNWGARHLVLSKDKADMKKKKDHIRYQYDEHYFMPDPDEFIQEFWPLDEQWQLLASPITKEEFEALPFVRSIFFEYNMRFDGHRLAVIHTDERGGTKITVRVPEEHENELVFFYQLRFADKEKQYETTYRGSPLERFVYQAMVDNAVTFSIHVPTTGSYFIEIFANKMDESFKLEDNGVNASPFKLKCACKFMIVCESLAGKMHPLPNCAAGEWGPKKAQRHFGMLPIVNRATDSDSGKAGMLSVVDNFELKFQMPYPYQCLAKLRKNHVDSKVLDPFVNLTSDGSTLSVYVSLPETGQFGLDIFARPKGAPRDSNTLSHACKYLINCTKVEAEVFIPKMEVSDSKRSKFGRTAAFDELGLKILSEEGPKIRVGKVNTISVEVQVPSGIALSFQFLREPDEDNRGNVTQTKESGGVVKLVATMTKTGNHMLSLYARREDSDDKSAANVYNFLLQYMPDNTAMPEDFPSKAPEKSKSSSIFKKSFFKKDSKDKDKAHDRSYDRWSDKSSDKSS